MTPTVKIYVALSTILTNVFVVWAIYLLFRGARFDTQMTIILTVLVIGTIADLLVFRSLKEPTGELGLGATGMVTNVGVVTESMGGSVKVSVRGETWSARVEGEASLPVGAAVEVVQVDGLVLIVRERP